MKIQQIVNVSVNFEKSYLHAYFHTQAHSHTENTSYSRMLNIAELVPPRESVGFAGIDRNSLEFVRID